jgi:hypothetical protein
MDPPARRDVSDRVRRAVELVARAELLKYMAHLRREATSDMIRRSARRLRVRAADPEGGTVAPRQPAARRTARCALWCEGACRGGPCRRRGPAAGPPPR